MSRPTIERLLAEKENLERILDNLTEGIIAHDPHRRILYFNRAAEEITGFSRKEVLGRDCHETFGHPFCGGRCAFLEGPPRALDHTEYPLNILTRSGEPRRLEMRVNGIEGEDGRLAGVIASFRDVTDLIGLQIEHGDLEGFAGIIGRDPEMLQVYARIRETATTDYPVCITGETGTGKELVAAAVHGESRRGGGPFVPVNSAALPEGMLESELFGHVKGAFTGALRDKRGRFDLADGGSLFLDEVSELPLVLQAKLLRVLQEGTFEAVGSEKTRKVNVRLITATNRDLKADVETGRFRKDLYYRVNVVPLHLPPLRERRDDIPLLAAHFLAMEAEEGTEPPAPSAEAVSLMRRYAWPGNVRELQSAIRFAVVRSRGRTILAEHLPGELRQLKADRPSRGPTRKLEPDAVRAALEKTGGNKARAARLLGVGRATLYRFLRDFTGRG
jgi:PAS domain S-box-containing protein